MTDLLRALLHEEADALDVPPAAAGDILRRGRGVRRRQRATSATAALAVVGVVAGTVFVATHDPAGRGSEQPAHHIDDEVVDTGATFTVGTTLWYDDATRSVEIPDAAVKSIYYTSAGILVRHGDNNWSDGGGEQRFSLVTPEGTVEPVSVVTEEVAHTTDPAQPYLAWVQSDDSGTATVVVHDVSTDEEVARWPVPAAPDGAFVTAVLAGETLFLRVLTDHDGEAFFRMQWRTGEITPTAEQPSDIGGGRVVYGRSVVDLVTGDVLWTASDESQLDLSPDGLFVLLSSWGPRQTYRVVTIGEDGAPVQLPEPASSYAWTAAGELYSVAADAVATCDPATGSCDDVPVDLGVTPRQLGETIRLGGVTYES